MKRSSCFAVPGLFSDMKRILLTSTWQKSLSLLLIFALLQLKFRTARAGGPRQQRHPYRNVKQRPHDQEQISFVTHRCMHARHLAVKSIELSPVHKTVAPTFSSLMAGGGLEVEEAPKIFHRTHLWSDLNVVILLRHYCRGRYKSRRQHEAFHSCAIFKACLTKSSLILTLPSRLNCTSWKTASNSNIRHPQRCFTERREEMKRKDSTMVSGLTVLKIS